MELGDIYPMVLTVILIGLILGVGIFTMAEVRENIATEKTGVDTDQNSSGTSYNNQTTLGDASKDDYYLRDIVSIYNTTGHTLVPTDCYNYSSNGVVTYTEGCAANGVYLFNITSTYIYDVADSPEAAANDSIEGIGDFADWIAVIIVVVAAAIILGVVIRSFGQGARV